MGKIYLSEKSISRCFWSALRSSACMGEATRDSNAIAELTAMQVDKFPSEAGSVSVTNGVYLWLISKYFAPATVLEIGTYIGRSALAILFGGRFSIDEMYTCDGTYDCLDFSAYKTEHLGSEKMNCIDRVHYFGKTMSTVVLKKLVAEGKKVDLVFIDGRISQEDCSLLGQVISQQCIFVLDDFEGVEKGVVNAVVLRNVLRNSLLIEPPVETSGETGNLAILAPASLLTLSRQQNLPVNM